MKIFLIILFNSAGNESFVFQDYFIYLHFFKFENNLLRTLNTTKTNRMKRFTAALLFFFLFFIAARAQEELKTALPVDPKIKTGVLPNGLKYYVRYNKKP